jgi:hypothetical protein
VPTDQAQDLSVARKQYVMTTEIQGTFLNPAYVGTPEDIAETATNAPPPTSSTPVVDTAHVHSIYSAMQSARMLRSSAAPLISVTLFGLLHMINGCQFLHGFTRHPLEQPESPDDVTPLHRFRDR